MYLLGLLFVSVWSTSLPADLRDPVIAAQFQTLSARCVTSIDALIRTEGCDVTANSSLTDCLTQVGRQWTERLQAATQRLDISGVRFTEQLERECPERIKSLMQLFYSATPFYGQVDVDVTVQAAFNKAFDYLAIMSGHYLNDYTCLEYVDLFVFREVLDRSDFIYKGHVPASKRQTDHDYFVYLRRQVDEAMGARTALMEMQVDGGVEASAVFQQTGRFDKTGSKRRLGYVPPHQPEKNWDDARGRVFLLNEQLTEVLDKEREERAEEVLLEQQDQDNLDRYEGLWESWRRCNQVHRKEQRPREP